MGQFKTEHIEEIITALNTIAMANGILNARTIKGTTDHIDVVNGDGVAGDPTISLAVANADPGTFIGSVTIDAHGRVTAAANLTTLHGYGIVDAQSLDADLHEARQQLAAMSILAENYKNQSDKTKSELAHAVKIIEDNLNQYNRVIDQLRNEDEIQNLHQQLDILREQLYLITSITKGDASTQTVERLRRLSITMKADQGTSPYNTPVEDRGTNPKTPPTPPTPPMHADQGTSPKTPSIIDLISSSSSGSASPELGPEDKIAKHIEDLIERVFDNANENNVVFPPQILNLMQNVQNDLTTLLFQAHGDFELGLGVDPTLMSGLNTINVLLEEAASPYTLKYGSLRAIVNLFEQSLYKIRQLQSHVSRRIRRGSGSSGGAMST